MFEAWQQWEGHTVDGKFPLLQCLAGSKRSAVFLTEFGAPEPRRAAIKLIQAETKTVERCLTRWRSCVTLSHPHLLRLLAGGVSSSDDGPLLYVVTDYADESLAQVLPDRPLSSEEVHQMLRPVSDALAYLHRHGHAHAGLKPAHVLATGDKIQLSIDSVRPFGEPAGSELPSIYDAPELAETGASPEADVWALGVVLVACLTQGPPSWESLEDDYVPQRNSLPAPFLEIARGCLRRDPGHRWKLSDIDSHLRQASQPLQAPKAPRPRYAGLAAALALGLLAVLAASRFIDFSPRTDSSPAAIQEPASEPESNPEPPLVAAAASSADVPEPPRAQRVDSPPTQPAAPEHSTDQASTPGAKLIPGELVRQVLPDVPTAASNTIDGQVRVRVKVRVDSSGQVENAELDSPGPSRYFADLALKAARRWEFAPAMLGGRPAPSEWLIRFIFTRRGTEVEPQALPTNNSTRQ